MSYLEEMNSFLSGRALPVLLIGVGIFFAVRLRLFYFLHPIKFAKDLISAGKGSGTSPFKALTVALAGTLGVGNISGVATAISAGGAGAVFWMWLSALAAMGVKYAEVYLAVRYRKTRIKNGKSEHYGGAPYYIRDALYLHIGKKAACVLSVAFSLLLVTNSLITGNIVQVNAASSVFEKVPPLAIGAFFAVLLCIVVSGGAKRVGDFAVGVIPVLSVVYLVLSLYIIFSNAAQIPAVFKAIFREAFGFRAAAGGVAGYGMMRAVRFGVTRGIFSNEAGCGTAPTAHAAADTRSPHHQGCFGVFEVFCDTVVLCTVTALVILLSKVEGKDAIPLAVASYGVFAGRGAEIFISVSVVIFALATVICQSYYGVEALFFVSDKKRMQVVYIILAAVCAVVGSVISVSLMWQIADLQIAVMTIINTLAVFILSDEILPPYRKDKKEKSLKKREPRT